MNVSDILGSQSNGASRPRVISDPNDLLGKDDFLRLLLEQLKNQDPTKPMGDREFVTQLAQFRTLEQMEATNNSLQSLLDYQHFSLASAMIGKTIDARVAGEQFSGTVSDVHIRDNLVLLNVDGVEVDLADVVRIGMPPAAPDTTEG